MLLSLRAVVRGKSGAGSASRGGAGEPPDAAVTMAVSGIAKALGIGWESIYLVLQVPSVLILRVPEAG
jgi:hypothetical protein